MKKDNIEMIKIEKLKYDYLYIHMQKPNVETHIMFSDDEAREIYKQLGEIYEND